MIGVYNVLGRSPAGHNVYALCLASVLTLLPLDFCPLSYPLSIPFQFPPLLHSFTIPLPTIVLPYLFIYSVPLFVYSLTGRHHAYTWYPRSKIFPYPSYPLFLLWFSLESCYLTPLISFVSHQYGFIFPAWV